MISTRCCYCAGRGWAWVGVASNAYKEACEPCQGRGRLRINWPTVGGVIAVLLSCALSLGIIVWSTQSAFGATAGSITLREFRALPDRIRSAMVVGAMATTEHAGLRCPDPQRSVGEYVSTLRWRELDESKPWIVYYFQIVTEQKCAMEDEEPEPITPRNGA